MMDFHCHLDLYPNAREVYAKANRLMDFTWLVTTSPRAFTATSNVLPPTASIIVSPGLHPEVAAQKAQELELLLQQMNESMAVGEVGLDGSARYRQHFDLQKSIFSAVVERAQTLGGRVLSIHSRAAANAVLEVLEQFPGFGTAVLHWFTDSAPTLRRAVSMGCWFSVGPAMLSSANGRKLASMLPFDRVVPESDGPFAKVDSTPLMPWDAGSIARPLAELWGMSPTAASEIFARNGDILRSRLTYKPRS